MTPKPYIGVTGVMTPQESRALLCAYPPDSTHHLMIGVLVSSKTLHGNPNKYPRLFPRIERAHEIFQDDERSLNLIHYSTDTPQHLNEELALLDRHLDHAPVDGLQLNVPWPPIEELQKYRERHPGERLVLQLSQAALDAYAGYPLADFSSSIHRYVPFITDILIDQSAGRGVQLNLENTRRFLSALTDVPSLGLGVAGGLGPSTLHLVEPLTRGFLNLSLDAQQGLRNHETQDLDVVVARAYLACALETFMGLSKPDAGTQKAKTVVRPSPFVSYAGNPDAIIDIEEE